MLNTSMTARSTAGAAAALSAVLFLGACGSSNLNRAPSSTSSTTSTPTGGASSGAPPSGAGPVGVEVHPPGDIPDNQAFVRYSGTGFTVITPEGWSRSNSGPAVLFSDKYNSITVTTAARPQAPTVASSKAVDVPSIKAASKGFVVGALTTVQRTAGAAVLITYRAYSPVNPVTGKVANEAVERYTFWKTGTSVTLTLAAPVGSDNVDPWRKVTDSFTWTK